MRLALCDQRCLHLCRPEARGNYNRYGVKALERIQRVHEVGDAQRRRIDDDDALDVQTFSAVLEEAFDGEAEVPPLAAVDSIERPSCVNRRLRRRHRIAEALGEVDPARDKLRFDRPAISHAHHADRTGVYTRDRVRTGVELFDVDARIGFVDHGNSSMAGRRAIALASFRCKHTTSATLLSIRSRRTRNRTLKVLRVASMHHPLHAAKFFVRAAAALPYC